MDERLYRIFLASLAGLAVVMFVVGVVSLAIAPADSLPAREIVKLIGIGLLPVAAGGLWWWQRWGFWALGLATLVVLGAGIPDGLFAALWRSILHFTMILCTVEQYVSRYRPDDKGRGKDRPKQTSSSAKPASSH
jgi:hypothetical protein